MRRFFSIVLVCIYAFSFTELHQLFKLPVLVQHFKEHQQLNQDLSFFQFLTLHYTAQDNQANDNENDMELPFRDFEHCTVLQTVVMPCLKIELKENSLDSNTFSYPVLYKKFIPSSYLSEIWQPPRI